MFPNERFKIKFPGNSLYVTFVNTVYLEPGSLRCEILSIIAFPAVYHQLENFIFLTRRCYDLLDSFSSSSTEILTVFSEF